MSDHADTVRAALSKLADEATRQVTERFPAPISGGEFSQSMRRTNDAYSDGLAALAALERERDEARKATAWWKENLNDRCVHLTERAERAERLRDEWMTPFDGDGIEWHEHLPSPYTYKASDFSALCAAAHQYEACAEAAERERDTLRAALEEIESFPISGYHAGAAQRMAREALASVRDEQAGSAPATPEAREGS